MGKQPVRRLESLCNVKLYLNFEESVIYRNLCEKGRNVDKLL